MKVFIVSYNLGIAPNTATLIAGVFTDEKLAEQVKTAVNGSIQEMDLDHIFAGYRTMLEGMLAQLPQTPVAQGKSK